MKANKRRFLLAVAFVISCVCAASVMFGCSGTPTPEPTPHEHTYTVWRHNDTEHWKECEALDGATTEKSKHTFVDGTCECGAVDTREFGSVVGKITLTGGNDPTDFGGVTVDFGETDVRVDIDEEGNFTATHVTVGKDYDVTVSKAGYDSYGALVRVGAKDETVTLTKPFALVYKRFDFWKGWDSAAHDLSRVNDAEPSIGIKTHKATLNLITRDSYDSVATSLWVKNGNSVNAEGVQGIFVKFENGKYMFARYQLDKGVHKLQWAKNFDGGKGWGGLTSVIEEWNDFQKPLTQSQQDKFDGESGLKVTVFRRGGTLYTYVDDVLVKGGTMTLPAEYADDKVQVGFFDYDSKENATWRFDIAKDVVSYESQLDAFTAPAVEATHGTAAFDKETYLYGERATVTFAPEEGYIVGAVTVNGKLVSAAVENNAYSFAVTGEINVQASFISPDKIDSVTFTAPAEANANGLKITLSRAGETDITGIFENNAFTAQNVKPGVWHAKTTQYGVDVALKDVYVGAETVELDTSGVFETAAAVNLGGTKTYTSGGENTFYSVPVNLKGDAYFAMKLQSPTVTDNTKDGRFGVRMFFGDNGDTGAREELGFTIVKEGGKWQFQQCGNPWRSQDIDGYLSAFENGVYMAIYREGATGKVHIYLGTQKSNLTEVRVFDQADETKITKKPIVRFGAAFWKGDFNATISDLMYGKTMAAALGEEVTPITVTGAGDVEVDHVKQGSIAVSDANKYENVTVTITEKDGFKLSGFTVNDTAVDPTKLTATGKGTYTYTLYCYTGATLKVGATFVDYARSDVDVTVTGRKMGKEVRLNGQVTFTNTVDATDVYTVTLANGTAKVTDMVTPATYRVTFEGSDYQAGQITLEKNQRAATISLEYKRFDPWKDWAADREKLDLTHVNDAEPTIGNDGKTLNVISRDTYDDVAVSLWMKDGNSVNAVGVQGAFVKFEDDQYMFLQCYKMKDGNHKLQWTTTFWSMTSVIGSAVDFQNPLTNAQKTKFDSDGLKVTILRKGNMLYTLVDGLLIQGGTMTLAEKYADDKVQVGFWDYDSKEKATWKFDIRAVDDVDTKTFDTVTFTMPTGANADGLKITLSRDGETDITGAFAENNTFTAQNVKGGVWTAKTVVYGAEVNFNVYVDANTVAINNLFESEAAVNLGGTKTYTSGGENAYYTVPVNITGDAYFAMKLQSSSVTDNTKDGRFGVRMFFGDNGDTGAREELGFTIVKEGGKWQFQQCGAPWRTQAIDGYLSAFANNVYMAIYREGATGKVHIYLGTQKSNLTEVRVFDNQADEAKTAKKPIVRFGAGFWKGNYNATISDLLYGKTMAAALGEEVTPIAVTGAGDVVVGSTKQGSIAVSDANVYENVTVTVTEQDGFKLSGFTVNDTAIDLTKLTATASGTYTYTLSCYTGNTLKVGATFVDYARSNVDVTVTGRKMGEEVRLNGQVTFTNIVDATDVYTVTLEDGEAKVTGMVTPATYSVTFEGYNAGQIKLEKNQLAATISLEYKRFDYWFGWATELHDFSAVNNEEPELKFKNTEKTDQYLNVISRDTYDDVAASLWMGTNKSVAAQEAQCIFVKFSNNKYMFLRCENLDKKAGGKFKLQWMQELKIKDTYEVANPQWIDFQNPLTTAQVAAFDTAAGLKVTLLRRGNILYTLVNDTLIQAGTVTLGAEYADLKVNVGYWTQGCKANSSRRFDIHAVDDVDTKTFDTVTFHVDAAAYNANGKTVTLSRDGETNITGTITNNAFTAQNVKGGLWTATVNMTVFGMDTSVVTPVWVESSTTGISLQPAMETSAYTPADLAQKRKYTGGVYYAATTQITGDAWFVTKLAFDSTDYKRTKSDGKDGDLRIGFRLYCGVRDWDHEADATLLFNGTNWQGGTCSNKSNWEKSSAISEEAKAALYGDGMYFAVFRNASTGELAYYVGASKTGLVKLTWVQGKEQIYEHCKEPIIRAGFGFWIDAGQYYSASANETMYYGSAQAFAAAGYKVA